MRCSGRASSCRIPDGMIVQNVLLQGDAGDGAPRVRDERQRRSDRDGKPRPRIRRANAHRQRDDANRPMLDVQRAHGAARGGDDAGGHYRRAARRAGGCRTANGARSSTRSRAATSAAAARSRWTIRRSVRRRRSSTIRCSERRTTRTISESTLMFGELAWGAPHLTRGIGGASASTSCRTSAGATSRFGSRTALGRRC